MVDKPGFDEAMGRQKAAARAAWKGSGDAASADIWFDIADSLGSTEFTGYSSDASDGQVVAVVKDGAQVDRAVAGDKVIVLTNQTPFYGESAGSRAMREQLQVRQASLRGLQIPASN